MWPQKPTTSRRHPNTTTPTCTAPNTQLTCLVWIGRVARTSGRHDTTLPRHELLKAWCRGGST